MLVHGGCTATHEHEVKASSIVYVRTDSDATTVISPTVSAAGQASDQVGVSASYTVDAWTGASIDVVTAATSAIRERRHEGQLGVSYDDGTLRVMGRYRGSYEHDYQSHGIVVSASRDFARHNTTLSGAVMGSGDTAGRSGDPNFAEPVGTGGFQLGLSQVLGERTIASVSWETDTVSGYQASPYRWVAVGGDGTCASTAPFCLPEHTPDTRVRNSASGHVRRAVGERASTGLDYRYYFDSWGIRSHTVEPSLTWVVSDATSLTLHYRYYAQREADFYRPRYFHFDDGGGYLTRDRKLSAFFANEVGAAYSHAWEFDDGDRQIDLGLRASLSRIDYLAYVGLVAVNALELTTMVSLGF
ncbi:MAG: DUF3570 domain-containing protein [Kofleriaceae bacterium]